MAPESPACDVQGLGEIYEAEFVQAQAAVTGTALEDKEEKVRGEARALTRALFAKLDALSHFQYAPKPVIEDLSIRADVPALAMEEVAPQVGTPAAANHSVPGCRQLPGTRLKPGRAVSNAQACGMPWVADPAGVDVGNPAPECYHKHAWQGCAAVTGAPMGHAGCRLSARRRCGCRRRCTGRMREALPGPRRS